ncbi:hypothetical protein BBF96_02200 [Anoxybacter fermentans]|uniref:Uncharacterized protein n=1 Tax=Anoxybacter fermentans TaxID=1323375 RepID=A0A3S9SVH4_9FIRM|nr:hypothetical protein [Anoxybacter fermentans]AZR72307.1 hypothetical protein BBF96_02200 [Anoxybacter fermentans]
MDEAKIEDGEDERVEELELRRMGYRGEFKKISMRRWRNSASPLINMALPNKWFDEIGLVNLQRYEVGVLHRYYE